MAESAERTIVKMTWTATTVDGALRTVVAVLILVALPNTTRAQQSSPVNRPLTSTFDAALLRDLPSADNLFSLLETTQAAVISDHFSGGVNPAKSVRLGAFLTSWTQTAFRIDDVDISSATRGGPVFVPPIAPWQHVSVTSGVVPADVSGPGLLISLEPLRPSGTWRATVTGSGSGEPLVAGGGGFAAPIARQTGFAHASGIVEGPIVPGKAAVLMSASTTHASQAERGSAAAMSGAIDSVYALLLYTPREGEQVRTLGWRQVASYPASHDQAYPEAGARRRETSTHVQSTWARGDASTARWRAFGAFTRRAFDRAAGLPSLPTIERLLDGPASILAEPGVGRERRWSAGVRGQTAVRRLFGASHTLQAGLDASVASFRADATGPVAIRERVGGVPARLWSYSATPETHRSRHGLAAFVTDRAVLGGDLTIDAALRFDRVRGRASGAQRGVTWNTWLPRAAAHWRVWEAGRSAVFASYSRTADSLLLDLLAYGDPAAPVADVFRWSGGPEIGPLVTRVGPGAGPDGRLTTLDPSLARPMTREVIAGVESGLPGGFRIRLAHLIKRAAHSIVAFNIGAPESSYAVSTIPDPGPNRLDPVDDQLLPIYNRLPGTFGQDRYFLSNSHQPEARVRGWVLIADRSSDRLYLSMGATMQFTDAPAGYRGFLPVENDLVAGGEIASNPNAATHARGNLFWDRQYTGKITGVFRLAGDLRVGAVARYQDGQPFARVVIAEGLNQGAEAIRAFRNGKSRFTFTGTLDVRVQKGFPLPGGHRAEFVVDGYNVLNLGKEVEEWVVTGPAFRTPTAVQPPLALHVGLRFVFSRNAGGADHP